MHPDGRAPHILISNHAPEILDLLQELLAEEGYRVTLHPRASEDLASVVAESPDLIIIDYMWPSSDNEWTLLNMLRIDRHTRHIPVILCTAAVRQVREMEDHLLRMGIRVVEKPFDIDELIAVIADALASVVAGEAGPGAPPPQP